MRRLLPILFCIFISTVACAQDLVIFRSGDEFNGHISQISNKEIVFSPSQAGRIVGQQGPDGKIRIDPKDLYMIKLKTRGNYYFLSDGRRISGEKQNSPKGADVIYLTKGGEIFSYQTDLNPTSVYYIPSKKQLNDPLAYIEIPLSDIFFIRYKDGTREIFNELIISEKEAIPEPQEEETKLKVIFYTLKAPMSLTEIATEYDVSVREIIEWNDMPSNYSPTKKLNAGTQFMLYVKAK